MASYCSNYDIKLKGSTLSEYRDKACFAAAKHAFSITEYIIVHVYKTYNAYTTNDVVLKYNEVDIIEWCRFLSKCGLYCTYLELNEFCYKIKIETNKHTYGSYLMTCQAMRYLYEKPKSDIPKWAMYFKKYYSLLDNMECLMLAHYSIDNMWCYEEHCMINGTVKPFTKWEFSNRNTATGKGPHELTNSVKNSKDWPIMHMLFKEQKYEELYKKLKHDE